LHVSSKFTSLHLPLALFDESSLRTAEGGEAIPDGRLLRASDRKRRVKTTRASGYYNDIFLFYVAHAGAKHFISMLNLRSFFTAFAYKI
jgi:hypothetical protein